VKDLSALRSKLEEHPRSKGDHCYAVMLLNRENSKKGHLDCHIYGIKQLATSQVICHGKGMKEIPCTHNFLCSLINESWKSHLLFMS